MIPRTIPQRQTPVWQIELARAITDPAELLQTLGLGREWLPGARRAARAFPLRVPRSYVARMRPGDPHDPLLRQVLPVGEENLPAPGFSQDPVGDLAAMPVPGLLHKYHGRALLIATGACAVHCRYCFRRHFPYAEAHASTAQWREAVDYLAARPDLTEVILSGGDPLALSDRRLAPLVRRLEQIPHLKRLRIHTRLPIVLPERVDDALLGWLSACRLRTILVVHANHANEIDGRVREALAALASSGVTLFNQSVLLRGVNDDCRALEALSVVLFDAGVLPYYLHVLDKVQGAAHFEVAQDTAVDLLEQLNTRLPGYLVPRLVREQPGAPGKLPLQRGPAFA